MFFLLHMFCKHSSHSGSLILLRKTKSHRQTLEIHVLGEKKKETTVEYEHYLKYHNTL